MSDLRTNNLSGEGGRNAIRGSVFFDGFGDKLSVPNSADIRLGSNDFTIEAWVKFGDTQGYWDTIIGMYDDSADRRTFTLARYKNTGQSNDGDLYLYVSTDGASDSGSAHGGNLTINHWHHVAGVRDGNTLRVYQNGVQVATGSYSGTVYNNTTDPLFIGDVESDDNKNMNGFISNVRICNGHCLYPDGTTFTPPTTELTSHYIAGDNKTVLLCCQDSDDVTQEATGKTITAYGNLTDAAYVRMQPTGIPPYGVDAGNTFGGAISMNSSAWMYFPTGRTEERGRGRAVFLGGGNPATTVISFIKIQSGGSAQNFGSLITSRNNLRGGSSSTRGLSTHDASSSPASNTITFITIATEGDATDFGDMSGSSSSGATGSNETRAVFWLGTVPSTGNTIDFATIATTGNTSDFGDMTVGVRHIDSMNSSTRCVIPGGWRASPDSNTNVIQYITFATTGNAQDFGDVDYTNGIRGAGGFSSPTRGVFAGGADTPSNNAVNIIHFVTLASTGNSTDFGDISAAKRIEGGGTSSHIRGLIAGSNSPAQINTIEFVTIATTGNSQDFGDLMSSRSQDGYVGALSDCHGGLS